MNSKVLYRKDIESLTRFPIIGELMFEKLEEPIVTKNAQRTFLQEQFRQIRAALKYQGNPKGNVKRILVTSSIKGEGKSFVSSNLAVSIARSGKKVALLELDLHQPKLREMFGISNCAGITDYLLGKTSESQIIIPTDIQPNLSLIPAGYLIEDPTELLLNGRLEMLLNYLDTVFDVLIIDTAPVLALTDATSISPLVNLVLYIIRHDHTPKTHIEFLDENMEAHNIENVALVFNSVKKRGYGRYSYGYGSGYGYGSKSSYDAYSKKKKVA
jgi:capsular exopolysaccharide synthesis family protein